MSKANRILRPGGGQFMADQYDLSLLAQIPLDPIVRQGVDEGKATGDAERPIATAFHQLTEKIAA